jgi:hypothetical protein
MPFGVVKPWTRLALPKPEFLSYPASTNVIDSIVLNATGVTADAPGTPYAGRLYLIQGTILSKRTDNQYERYVASAGQTIAGILYDTVEFADNTDKSDEPAAMVRRNVEFKKSAIIDYATYETALKAALTTCEFV